MLSIYQKLLFIFSAFGVWEINAQVELTVTIHGFNGDTIYLGKYLGKRMVKEIPVAKSGDGTFVIRPNTAMPHGLYNIVYTSPGESLNRGFPIVLSDASKKIFVSCQLADPMKSMVVTGSPETQLYLNYFSKIDDFMNKYSDAVDAWRLFQNEESFIQMSLLEKQMNEYQISTQQANPNTYVASIIEITRIQAPFTSGNLAEMVKTRQSCFDKNFKIDHVATNDLFWTCPLSILWLDVQAIRSHDTDMNAAIVRVKKIIDYISPNKPAYNYYLNYLLNSFQRMSKNNLDQIYVSLVRDVVEKGKAPFLSQDERSKHSFYANNIDRLKIGNKAPDAMLYKEDKSSLLLSGIKAPYTLLLFWAPDCSHCKKELPIVKRVLERYQSKKIQVVTSCTKSGDALSDCYQYLKANFPNENWLNLGDPKNEAHMGNLYNVTGTPAVYLLDADKIIKYKRRGEMEEYEWDVLFSKL